jgi:hypothetical protein
VRSFVDDTGVAPGKAGAASWCGKASKSATMMRDPGLRNSERDSCH